MFSHERYAEILAQTIQEIQKLGTLKGGEYAGDNDRLANFRRNGLNLGLPMSTVWAVYAGKHWDAIQQFVQDHRNGKSRERLETIDGRVDDLLVYLLLFKCILEEERSTGKTAYEILTQTFKKPEPYDGDEVDPPVDIRTRPDYKVGPHGEEVSK